ncbi:hypothetical protein N7535_008165 [Penicillium sp. DV-2018c]|nr:hypothetical protein N7535_008165 [Penicillium sp. DV-2018c]
MTPTAKRSVESPRSSKHQNKRQKQYSDQGSPPSTDTAYKASNYAREMLARGVQVSDETPTNYTDMLSHLESRPINWLDLPGRTLDSFDTILRRAGNEGSIQSGIVPLLMDYMGLMLNPQTMVVVDMPFSKECKLPVQNPRDNVKRVPAPYPDVSVGLRRSLFKGHGPALYNLGDIASPIPKIPHLVFPCFAVEVKGGTGGMDAETQNGHNLAVMLFNLRQLSVLANGEDTTHATFDGVIKACSATVTQQGTTIFCHWIEKDEETRYLSFYSRGVASFGFAGITYEGWNRAAMYLRNAISFTVQQTLGQVQKDLLKLDERGWSYEGNQE